MSSVAEPTRRLFIGLVPDASVQAAIDFQRQAWHWPPGCRLTRPQRMHLTLHFLGEVDGPHQAALQDVLADVPMQGLTLVLGTPQVWRNHVAVLLVDEHEGLRALHAGLALQLVRAGLVPARARWTPHVTIAREASGAVPPADPQPIRWRVAAFVLVWSRLAPDWRHEVLARYPAPPSH